MTFRPTLRPGAPLLRRDATHLQIGTSPGIVLVDRPGLAALLRLLDGVRDLARIESLVARDVPELDGDVADLLDELRAAGAVVDAAEIDAARGRLQGRPIGFISSAGAFELVAATRAVLVAAGVDEVTSSDPELMVIVSHGEAARSVFEKVSLVGLDHLPVVIDEDRVRIGPLVRPGRTPCITCHDLHRADWDPAWRAIVPQLGRRLPHAHPSAVAGLTLYAAAVDVAAEIVALLDEGPLRTEGRCLVVGPAHDERSVWPVAFHHRCSCALLSAA
jgi:bacteriocin biosynthesis cyclodehydratase domain-containing protein